MPKAYSGDLRVRVIEMVQAGASRREAAEVFSLAGSTAVKWLQRWEESGSAEAKPRGGSVSPLEVHAMVILEVVWAQPDATFVELMVVTNVFSWNSGLRQRLERGSTQAIGGTASYLIGVLRILAETKAFNPPRQAEL